MSGNADFETDPRNVRRIQPLVNTAELPANTAGADLVAAAIDLDPMAARRLLDEHFASSSFEHAVDDSLPELERLGAAWANGDVTVAGEHIVAAAVQRRLSAAFDAAAMESERYPFLLTGLPAGCRHELGILAYATAARRRGMTVLHLGPDLPLRDWLVAVERHQPDAVVMAVPTIADIQPGSTDDQRPRRAPGPDCRGRALPARDPGSGRALGRSAGGRPWTLDRQRSNQARRPLGTRA